MKYIYKITGKVSLILYIFMLYQFILGIYVNMVA